ncbi:hypothetical protein DFJ73DRAFT_912694 [Zopfochytrium polystomum]|nr:hypothetical protein DFJ73DRAFT_912694 [Zopfochytrium polystomum]
MSTPIYYDSKSVDAYANFLHHHTITLHQQVDGTPAVVLDAWIEKVFVGEHTILDQGTGRGRVGLKRLLAVPNAHETILAVGLPPEDDVDGAAASASRVPTVLFDMGPFGIIPWSAMLSLVEFVPVDGGKKTAIKWGVKILPMKKEDGEFVDDSQILERITALLKKEIDEFAHGYGK